MKNKVDFKRCLLVAGLTMIFLTILIVLFDIYEYRSYQKNYNLSIEAILEKVKSEYPNVDTEDLINILNDANIRESNILERYGIDIAAESVVEANEILHQKFIILTASLAVSSFLVISAIYLYYINSKEEKIKDIITLLERINAKNYALDIALTSEDELSILRTELYKTTVMLKEQAENSLEDKLKLKDSLSDISHQLKTPLTSIMITLDNLLDNPNMDPSLREEFLQSINRETANINFLIQSLLKLSRLDTDTVEFTKKDIAVSNLLSASIQNVSVLADLDDIEIDLKVSDDVTLRCDASWQTEAITNILKNAIEHSEEHGTITITTKENKLYTSIAIHNEGLPIDKKDIPHIFERFYRGKNASSNSVGIGLALAKSIITKENGSLEVESTMEKGTTFTIKYYKR